MSFIRQFFRQYVAPLIVLLIFLVALFAVSIRIFLPSDMAAPAPLSQVNQVNLKLNTAQNMIEQLWS
jgi:hypothetical protein